MSAGCRSGAGGAVDNGLEGTCTSIHHNTLIFKYTVLIYTVNPNTVYMQYSYSSSSATVVLL